MPIHMCMGSLMKCTHGLTPSVLNVVPKNMTLTSGQLVATIMDFIPKFERATFWDVQQPCQSHGSVGDGSGHGGTHANAVHSGAIWTVAGWYTTDIGHWGRRRTHVESCVDAHL